MYNKTRIYRAFLLLISLVMLASGSYAQKSKSKKATKDEKPEGRAVMWDKVDVEKRDLFAGPGGEAMRPDLSKVEFIERERHGYNKKYRIKDGSGQVWVAKYGREAKPETAAVRLLWGLGYRTEINYSVPELTIPTVGKLRNVRLEARPKEIKRLEMWDWKNNPFVGTKELQGLKIMVALLNDWDNDRHNNKVVFDKENGEFEYLISDLGATFGKHGSNNLPVIWRLGRSIGKPDSYAKAKFITGVKNGRVRFSWKGKGGYLFKDISVEQARWLADLLLRLNDKQIEDAFRAADYSPREIDVLTGAVKRRITELDRAAGERNLGSRIKLNDE